MIYGANGYTGELIAREAAARGLRPLLAGRNAAAIEPLARELDLEWRVFGLDRPDLSGVTAVLHCAGPFVHTSGPMVDACLTAGAHYLDITGEITVFESIWPRDAIARERGVALIPGVGFDVVPTDCLASMLHERMPDATELWLAFWMKGGGISRGTLRTMLEGTYRGGAIRRGGRIVPVPHLWDVREVPFASGSRTAATIPWGDVSSAFRSTSISGIRVYSAQSPRAIRRMKALRPLLPILGVPVIKRLAQRVAARTPGPSPRQRASGRVELWGRVANVRGEEVSMRMTVAEGYTFTVRSALAAVERLMGSPVSGALTPSLAFGSGFAVTIEGTTVEQ